MYKYMYGYTVQVYSIHLHCLSTVHTLWQGLDAAEPMQADSIGPAAYNGDQVAVAQEYRAGRRGGIAVASWCMRTGKGELAISNRFRLPEVTGRLREHKWRASHVAGA